MPRLGASAKDAGRERAKPGPRSASEGLRPAHPIYLWGRRRRFQDRLETGKGALQEMRERVEQALDTIRPALNADGGDVELVEVTEDGIVKVKLVGACGGCPMSQMTLQMGIERVLKKEIPELKSVVAV